MNRLLDTFDEWARATGHDEVDAPHRLAPTHAPTNPALDIDLIAGGIGTIIWATGYRPDYTWLDVPVLDRKGRIRHDGGIVTDAPGMYLLGANLLRRRRSSYVNGAETDTAELSTHLHTYLDRPHHLTPPSRSH